MNNHRHEISQIMHDISRAQYTLVMMLERGSLTCSAEVCADLETALKRLKALQGKARA
jgi:hypothetical protein